MIQSCRAAAATSSDSLPLIISGAVPTGDLRAPLFSATRRDLSLGQIGGSFSAALRWRGFGGGGGWYVQAETFQRPSPWESRVCSRARGVAAVVPPSQTEVARLRVGAIWGAACGWMTLTDTSSRTAAWVMTHSGPGEKQSGIFKQHPPASPLSRPACKTWWLVTWTPFQALMGPSELYKCITSALNAALGPAASRWLRLCALHNAHEMLHLREFKTNRWTRGNSELLRNNVNHQLWKEGRDTMMMLCVSVCV